MVAQVFFWGASFFFASLAFGNSNPGTNALLLTQENVAQRVLEKSFKSLEIQASNRTARLALVSAEALNDWILNAEAGYQMSRLRNFQGSNNLQDETYSSLIGVRRLFLSGTTFSAQLNRNSLQSIVNPNSIFSGQAPQQTQDLLGLEVQQSLWKNSFGSSDRAQLQAARGTFQATELVSLSQMQALVLEAIRLFWQTSVQQQVFKQALGARDRYETLVEVVRKKNKLGSASPGELFQVEAELENQIQQTKTSSQEFLKSLHQLLTLLHYEKTENVNFELPARVPPLIPRTEKKIESLREIKVQEAKLQSAEHMLDWARFKNRLDVSLVGRYEIGGIGTSASAASSEMTSGQFPRAYYGVRLALPLGSGILQEDEANKRSQRDLQSSILSRRKMELADEIQAAERKVIATHAVAESSIKQKSLRESAAADLQKAYSQGRLDIKFLIDALNLAFATQVNSLRSVGDHYIALNELAALRDELVRDPKEE
ncbi:MAG: hypothetical protein WCH11_06035 [Bdellovibrio sp.]